MEYNDVIPNAEFIIELVNVILNNRTLNLQLIIYYQER